MRKHKDAVTFILQLLFITAFVLIVAYKAYPMPVEKIYDSPRAPKIIFRIPSQVNLEILEVNGNWVKYRLDFKFKFMWLEFTPKSEGIPIEGWVYIKEGK